MTTKRSAPARRRTLTVKTVMLSLAISLGLSTLPAQASDHTVIVALFDGLAPSMVLAAQTPALDRMRQEGAWSDHLVPAFPTVSLINHTTFATGCWPAQHGIVSNMFRDPELGFYDHSRDADWRTGCETLWEAAERQGVVAAVLGFTSRWSGRNGATATYAGPLIPWEEEPTDEERVEEVIRLLNKPGDARPALIAVYFKGPDHDAHYAGLGAPETIAATRNTDTVIAKLMAAMTALPAEHEATLVIGTDHGMVEVGPMVHIARIIKGRDIQAKVSASGASAFVYLDQDESMDRVEKIFKEYEVFDTYRKGAYPDFAHVGNGPRSGDFLLVAQPPYWMEGLESFPEFAVQWLGAESLWPEVFTPLVGGIKATHGYDPSLVDMHGVFYAWGARVKAGMELEQLDMIDIHPTVMALMGLESGQPVDGQVRSAIIK